MNRLKNLLQRIDGKGYKAYKDIKGTYRNKEYQLHIDYVQGDPFASPSRIRIEVSHQISNFKPEWYQSSVRNIAFRDFISREVNKNIIKHHKNRNGTGKSGLILIDSPRQEVLDCTSCIVKEESIEIRLSLGLPARGRKILGKEAISMLFDSLPIIFKESIFQFDKYQLNTHLELADQQEAIRDYIRENHYLCFIANGSILPRESGISNRPLHRNDAIAFQSPSSLEVEIPVPHREPIKGMAIPEGVHLIVGGGYHGKSTLLKAIERGVYNHISGDGREYVITNSSAFKVRAEDGRRVEKVNISPFISNLPFQVDTTKFSTDDASGSTSQATNIIECIEAGSKVLLIDEDTSATNFMIRDARMQELVGKEKEPITPFIDKVKQLFSDYHISTILVIGGSGDYFDVADSVIMMDEYKPIDVTEKAREISKIIKYLRNPEGKSQFGEISHRIIQRDSFNAFIGKKEKIDAKGLHKIIYGKNDIDLSFIEQLVDQSQTRAIALMIRYISNNLVNDALSIHEILDKLYYEIEHKGLEIISPYFGKHPGDLALPRRLELVAAINRLRSLKIK